MSEETREPQETQEQVPVEPGPPPAPAERLPKEVRNWAMLAHLSALSGLLGNGIGFLLGPLVVWLVKREEHPFIDEAGKQSLNFQITMFLAMILCVPLMFVFIGILLMPVIGILDVVLTVVAAVKTSNGEDYRYPLAIPFLT